MDFEIFKIETFIPEEYIKKIRKELNNIGALTVEGNYDNCMAISKVKGSWRALEGADPFNGDIDKLCETEECKIEFCCTKEVLNNTITTIKKIHPYEIPVINIIPILNPFKF